ncbi:unnamed protein product [Phaeothamnion confervicola]
MPGAGKKAAAAAPEATTGGSSDGTDGGSGGGRGGGGGRPRSGSVTLAAPSTRVVEDDVKECFLRWAKDDIGVELHPGISLFHAFREDYRGVIATRDIEAGEVLVRIRQASCIGPAAEDATREEWTQAMTSAGVRSMTGPSFTDCGGPNGSAAAAVAAAAAVPAADGSRAAGAAANGMPPAPGPADAAASVSPPKQPRSSEAAAASAVSAASAGLAPPSSPHLTKACFTVLRLLHELGLGDASPFAPYLAVLPCAHRIPIQWTAEERALLRGTAAETLAAAGRLEKDFRVFEAVRALHPGLWAAGVCTAEAFARAVMWVRSRGFTVFGDPFMVPCADMFNHDPDQQNVEFRSDGEAHFEMVAVRRVPRGGELFASVGRLPNCTLVDSFGFVLKDNAFDTVPIPTATVTAACERMFRRLAAAKTEAAAAAAAAGGAEAGMTTEATTADAVAVAAADAAATESWKRRIGMARGQGLLPAEGFVVSKYDLMPEDLVSLLQVLTMSDDPTLVYGAMLEVVADKMASYAIRKESVEVIVDDLYASDAYDVARALVREEHKVLQDLGAQLRREILEGDEDDDDGGGGGGGSSGGSDGDGGENGVSGGGAGGGRGGGDGGDGGEEADEEDLGSAAMAAAMNARGGQKRRGGGGGGSSSGGARKKGKGSRR